MNWFDRIDIFSIVIQETVHDVNSRSRSTWVVAGTGPDRRLSRFVMFSRGRPRPVVTRLLNFEWHTNFRASWSSFVGVAKKKNYIPFSRSSLRHFSHVWGLLFFLERSKCELIRIKFPEKIQEIFKKSPTFSCDFRWFLPIF